MNIVMGCIIAILALTAAFALLAIALTLPEAFPKLRLAPPEGSPRIYSNKPMPTLPTSRLMTTMALFVLPGIPLVAYLWHVINKTLSLHVAPQALLIGGVILLILLGLLTVLARRVTTWTGL